MDEEQNVEESAEDQDLINYEKQQKVSQALDNYDKYGK